MADAIISVVVERVATIIEEQIRQEINLVRGVEKEVRNLSAELKKVQNLLDDADRRGFKDKCIKDWLKRLEDTTYEMEDVLDEWEMAILEHKMEHESNDAVAAPPKQKVCSFVPSSCLCFKKVVVRRDIAKKIKNVKEQLGEILEEKDQYNFLMSQPTIDKSWRGQSTSFVDLAEVHGRDFDSEILLAKLMADGCRQEELGIQVLSIVGVGGLGKTTLAQLVFNNNQVKEHFNKLCIWVCVSDLFDEVGIAKSIVEGVKKESSPNTNNLQMLQESVRDCVLRKKFFLVLDDVWTHDYAKWERLKNSLKCGRAGSKILVTTRDERVAKMMGTTENDIYHLGQLSDEDCWSLLGRMALSGRNEEEGKRFEDIGKKIANKCRGLPLAAKTLGSHLHFKNSLEEWENVLNNEIWLQKAEDGLFPHLLLSYNDLPLALKRCFSYCAVFPKDFRINVQRLIEYWMALGYLGSDIGSATNKELRGREYFDILAMRSLFQDFEVDDLDGQIKRCKMHDRVHDFAQFLSNDRNNGRSCSPSLVSYVKKYRTIIWNDEEAPPNLCGCPTSLRVLRMPDQSLDGVPHEIRSLIHLRWLDLSRNKISREEDTKAICKLYNLQFLRLKFCDLKEIPREIGNLKYLRHLDLSHNNLSREDTKAICKLYNLEFLGLQSCALEEIPWEIGNLEHLRHLDLRYNRISGEDTKIICKLYNLRFLRLESCDLKEIPWEIGKLKYLRHLDLSSNYDLGELPESMCDLHELRTLNIDFCSNIIKFPEGIHRLVNLKHIHNQEVGPSIQLNEGIAQLSGLRTLTGFYAGSGVGKLGWLKNLNHLSGFLELKIKLTDHKMKDVVEDAREAELSKKKHIQELWINFEDEMDEKDELSSVRIDVINALEPHPNLRNLRIYSYEGFKLPNWIASPISQLRDIYLCRMNHLSSLPSLGKLPFLEELFINGMSELQFVGREFLGMAGIIGGGDNVGVHESSSSSVAAAATNTAIVFPKLKKLKFRDCPKWKEWEDITAEEEGSAALSLMPCLTELSLHYCTALTTLPHHLLRKVPSLEVLNIYESTELIQRYWGKDRYAWQSISRNNRRLQLKNE